MDELWDGIRITKTILGLILGMGCGAFVGRYIVYMVLNRDNSAGNKSRTVVNAQAPKMAVKERFITSAVGLAFTVFGGVFAYWGITGNIPEGVHVSAGVSLPGVGIFFAAIGIFVLSFGLFGKRKG
ncbi:MAG: hypothetical protein MJ119_04910 [Lachnospiraceae bacterium]|nr:hypothetical protein [Lachnospiraceae bacterium]